MFKPVIYQKCISPKKSYLLAADIGGTKSNFGVINIKSNSTKLVMTIEIESKKIDDFGKTIQNILQFLHKTYKIKIVTASLAAAGVLSADRTSLKTTNIKINLDKKETLKKTSLKKLFLLNDLEAIGYAL